MQYTKALLLTAMQREHSALNAWSIKRVERDSHVNGRRLQKIVLPHANTRFGQTAKFFERSTNG